jgi:hypothetical protein
MDDTLPTSLTLLLPLVLVCLGLGARPVLNRMLALERARMRDMGARVRRVRVPGDGWVRLGVARGRNSDSPSPTPSLVTDELRFEDIETGVNYSIRAGSELCMGRVPGARVIPAGFVVTAGGAAHEHSFEVPGGTELDLLCVVPEHMAAFRGGTAEVAPYRGLLAAGAPVDEPHEEMQRRARSWARPLLVAMLTGAVSVVPVVGIPLWGCAVSLLVMNALGAWVRVLDGSTRSFGSPSELLAAAPRRSV